MRAIFLILLSFTLSAQIPSDAKHFYCTVGICEATYHTQRLLLPKQKEHNRFLISLGTGLTLGISKEIFDAKRCNREKRTGFDKLDLATDCWGLLLWVPFRICLNDFNKNKREHSRTNITSP